MVKEIDDYKWETYTDEYSAQIKEMEQSGFQFLIKDSFIENGEIIFKDPIHENWKEIYNQIITHNVNSVFECGCGSAYHLQNIKNLKPKLKIGGAELLQTQVDFGKNYLKIDNDVIESIIIADLSMPFLIKDKYEFVYTQAVLMHLNHNKTLTFIKNMANLSSKYIFLIEAWTCHDFPKLFLESGILNNFSFEHINGKYRDGILLTNAKI